LKLAHFIIYNRLCRFKLDPLNFSFWRALQQNCIDKRSETLTVQSVFCYTAVADKSEHNKRGAWPTAKNSSHSD